MTRAAAAIAALFPVTPALPAPVRSMPPSDRAPARGEDVGQGQPEAPAERVAGATGQEGWGILLGVAAMGATLRRRALH